MKKVIILGAGGGLAKHVIDNLMAQPDIQLTLFLRNKQDLSSKAASQCRVIEGDVMDFETLKMSMAGQDVVYVNLSGNLEAMAKNIVKTMRETQVNRIIAISSMGIYESPMKPILIPYRKLADIIETSGLIYTILRPTWFTDANDVDYELTHKGEPEKGAVISKRSLAVLISKIIERPGEFANQNLGVNKPNS